MRDQAWGQTMKVRVYSVTMRKHQRFLQAENDRIIFEKMMRKIGSSDDAVSSESRLQDNIIIKIPKVLASNTLSTPRPTLLVDRAISVELKRILA